MRDQMTLDAHTFYDSLSTDLQELLTSDIHEVMYSEIYTNYRKIHPFLKNFYEKKLVNVIHRNVFQYQNQKNQELIIQTIETTYFFKTYHFLKIFYNFQEVSIDFLQELLNYSQSKVPVIE
ncbi:hypothetical protein [Enterococcus camelliae]|jgi:hypothetical protein|uniref:Transcriptional regulator n=1 Tax=Enterococcus camelliae TaxID=453959 RepID=A0ABW5TL35_9ENTE